jgi:hypothetical protein
MATVFQQAASTLRFPLLRAIVVPVLCAAAHATALVLPARGDQTPSVGGPVPAQSPTIDLTMTRAVEMAMEANLGLQADRLSLESADHAVAAARAAFLPQLNTTVSRQSARSVPSAGGVGHHEPGVIVQFVARADAACRRDAVQRVVEQQSSHSVGR